MWFKRAGHHTYFTLTALFPLMTRALCLHMGFQGRERCQCQDFFLLLLFWCQVSGQRPPLHAALHYGHHSQSSHDPHVTVSKDGTVSCRGQQHPATGLNCPTTDSRLNFSPHWAYFPRLAICYTVTFFIHTTDNITSMT